MEAKNYLERGNKELEEKNFQSAFREYNQAISANPNSSEAYRQRGKVWYEQGYYKKALGDFQKAIQLNNTDHVPHLYISLIYYKQNKVEAALEALTHAIILQPSSEVAYNNRGMIYFSQHKFDLAVNDFTTAIHLSEINDFCEKRTFFYNRGETYFKLNKINEAIDDYRQTIILNPYFNIDKYYIVDKIKQFPDKVALALLQECNDKKTTLGAFIWKKKGRLECSRSRGAAKKVYDEILKLNNRNHKSNQSLIGFFKQKLRRQDDPEESGIELNLTNFQNKQVIP